MRLRIKITAIVAAFFSLLIFTGLFLGSTGFFDGSKSIAENIMSPTPNQTNPPEQTPPTPTQVPIPTPTSTPEPAPVAVPVEFTCDAGTKYAFTFIVNVNLGDGMSSDEAIAVAGSLYEHELKQQNYEVKSVQCDGGDCWTVYLLWGSVSPSGEIESHGHYFNVHVNATSRTVSYDRCL
jgi:hypothetical protein